MIDRSLLTRRAGRAKLQWMQITFHERLLRKDIREGILNITIDAIRRRLNSARKITYRHLVA